MKVSTQDYSDVTVITLQGDLDEDFVELFQDTLMTVVNKRKLGVVIDLTDISFIDSCGLEKLIWARDYCYENSCQLRLAGLDQCCTKIMEVTRLINEFEHYIELSEAVKSFA